MDAPQTRATTDNTWNGDEEVRVVLSNAATLDGTYTFTADASGTLTHTPTLYWSTSTANAHAWYPINYTFPADQSTGIQAADFIFALDVSISSASPILPISHKTAKVTANLLPGSGISDVSSATVTFYGYTQSSNVNTATGVITGSTNGDIQPLKSGDSYKALLLPQDMSSSHWFIKVSLGGSDYYYTPEAAGDNLEAGKSYTYSIEVNKTDLTVTLSSNANWGAGTTYNQTGVVPTIFLEGCSASTATIKYKDGTVVSGIPIVAGYLSYTPTGTKIIKSITPSGGNEILIGRREDEKINLKFSGTSLVFRPTVSGSIPIGSYAEFQLIGTDGTTMSGIYKQEADLDLLGVNADGSWSGQQWTAIGDFYSSRFTGTFDGGGKAISNLYIDNTSEEDQGIFSIIGNGGTVKNVRIASGSVTGSDFVGGVSAHSYGTITACSNSGSVSGGNYIGGVVGVNYPDGSITACYNTGTVSGGYMDVGGVAGANTSGIITACYNIGNVTGTVYVGSVVGYNDSGTITACYWRAGTATNGISGGNGGTGTGGTTLFSSSAWPATGTHTQWGTGNGSGSGKYWKTLGGWDDVTPTYPKLWWE
jgi:hypothetical protein